MGKCGNVKQKHFRRIYADSEISTHIQAYSGIIWDIQNPDIFKIMTYLKVDTYSILGYSEPWAIQNLKQI